MRVKRLALSLIGACLALLAMLGAGPAPAALPLRGVNLSGAELNGDRLPGRLNFDYVYPTEAELDYFAAAGMTVIRLPVLWERLQPTLGGALDARELGYVRRMVEATRRRKLSLIIDAHGYGAYRGQKIGSTFVSNASFADFWGRMAWAFNGDANVIFGLMNEPNGISAEAWAVSAQAAINAIRAAAFRQLVLVPGTGWDGAHNFVSGAGYGTPNAAALVGLTDPAGAMAFEVHQYLDIDYSGTHADCPAAQKEFALLEPFTTWLRAFHQRGFLGEIGVSQLAECVSALRKLFDHIAANADVWAGWAYWAAGPWWSSTYPFSIEPRTGTEPAQLKTIRTFLPASR